MIHYSSILKDDLRGPQRFEVVCKQNSAAVVDAYDGIISNSTEREASSNFPPDAYGDRYTDGNDSLYADYRSSAFYEGYINDAICSGYASLVWEWSEPFHEERNEWDNDALYGEVAGYYQMGEGRSVI